MGEWCCKLQGHAMTATMLALKSKLVWRSFTVMMIIIVPSPKFYDCLDSTDSALGDGPDSCRGSCLIANERRRGRKFLVEEKIFSLSCFTPDHWRWIWWGCLFPYGPGSKTFIDYGTYPLVSILSHVKTSSDFSSVLFREHVAELKN